MAICNKECVLYGLDNYTLVISDIINELEARDYEFDIKMILTEAISNAFYHGNNSNSKLPIFIRYILSLNNVTFEIEDCGGGIRDISKLTCIDNNDLLSEGNRGLFLIGCYADKVEFHNNILKVEKKLS